jgi:hypothetical protein
MKWWIGLVLTLCAGVVWFAVPPRGSDYVNRGMVAPARFSGSPEEQHQRRLTHAVRQANVRLQTLRWQDSIVPLVVAHGTRGAYLGLPAGADRAAAASIRVRDLIASEVPPDEEGEAAVGVALLPPGTSGYPGALSARISGFYLGTRDGVPYCLSVHALGGPAGDGDATDVLRRTVNQALSSGTGSLSGICRWIHRYGLPSGDMRQWIESRGAVVGSALPEFQQGPIRWTVSARFVRRGAFGLPGGPSFVSFGGSLIWALEGERDRCLSGDPDACRDGVVGTADGEQPSSFLGMGPTTGYGTALTGTFGVSAWRQDHYLLSTLERRFGSERFQAFWSSDAPVAQAFETAFGEPMGPWLLDWYGETTDIVPPGPEPRAAGLVGSFLVLLLSGMVAGFFVRRWQV